MRFVFMGGNMFGKLVSQARKRSKLTYSALADLVGDKTGQIITYQSVQSWCNGTIPNSRSKLIGLCAALYSAGGLRTLEEINHLLLTAEAGALHQSEIEKSFPELVSNPLPPPTTQNDKDDEDAEDENDDKPVAMQSRSVHLIGTLLDFGKSPSTISLPDSGSMTPDKVPPTLRQYPLAGVLSVLFILLFATMSLIWSMSGEPENVPPLTANVTENSTNSINTGNKSAANQTPLSFTPTQTTMLTDTPSLITPSILTSTSESTMTETAGIALSTPTSQITTTTPIPSLIPTTTTSVTLSSAATVPPLSPIMPTDTPTLLPPPPTHTPLPPPPTSTHTPLPPPTSTHTPLPPPTSTHTPTPPPTSTHTPTATSTMTVTPSPTKIVVLRTVYRTDPTGFVCGPRPDQATTDDGRIGIEVIPDDDNRRITIKLSKCNFENFRKGGKAFVHIDGDEYIWGPIMYESGKPSHLIIIDPIAIGYTGSHTYQVYIEPEGEEGEAPHISGLVTVWDEQIVE